MLGDPVLVACCGVPHVILPGLGWEQVWLSSEGKTL